MLENTGGMLGIPAVKLNLVAAWGGLERLPRLVGMTKALDLLVSGRSIDDAEATGIGLVAIVAPARLEIELAHLATVPGFGSSRPPGLPRGVPRSSLSASRVRAGNDEHRRPRSHARRDREPAPARGRESARDAHDGLAGAWPGPARPARRSSISSPGRDGRG